MAPDPNLKFRGLQFLCNQNNGTQLYDFVVEGDGQYPPSPLNGIRYYQGGDGSQVGAAPAGNLFTHSCQTGESDYYYRVPGGLVYNYSVSDQQQVPQCYSTNVLLVDYPYGSNCPTKFSTKNPDGIIPPTERSALLANFAMKNAQYLLVADLYKNLIDNGNTLGLLNAVAPSTTDDSEQVASLLLSTSPNLSDRVVQEIIKDNNSLSNSTFLSIIAANPDVAHNEEVLRMLKEKSNPMEDWMIELLREAGTYETNRTALEKLFAQKQFDREEAAWQMVRHILSDTLTLTNDHSQLHFWLNIIGSPRAKYLLVDDLASMGQFDQAAQVLDNFDVKNLDRFEVAELSGLKTWLNLQKKLASTNRTMYQLDSNEIGTIKPLADNERLYGLAGTFAANVLNHYTPNSYPQINIYPPIPGALRTSSDSFKPTQHRTLKKLNPGMKKTEPNLTLFPNPATSMVTIGFDSALKASQLNVVSMKGELVFSKNGLSEGCFNLNTSTFENGAYLIQVLDAAGHVVKTEKLHVVHP